MNISLTTLVALAITLAVLAAVQPLLEAARVLQTG